MTRNTQGLSGSWFTATRDVLASMGSEEEITLTAIAILESSLRSSDPDAVITAMVALLGDTVWTQDGMMSLVSVMMVLFTTLAAATDAPLAAALLASIRERTLGQTS